MAAHRKFSEQDAESFSDEESDLARTNTFSRNSTLSSISESTYESVGSSSEESDFSRLLKDAEYAHTVDSDDASRSLPENWDELSWKIDTESLAWSEWEEISDEDDDDGLPLNLSKRVSKRRPRSLRYSKQVSLQDPTRESRRMSRRASKRMSLRRSVRIPGGFKRAFGSARSPNPFDSPDKDLPLAQLIELIVLGPFLVPIRVLWFVLIFVISSLLLQLSVVGANLHKPLGSIRMGFQSRVSSMAARAMLWSFGVTSIDVRGRQALPEQCRILVAASHSSPIDALVISAVVSGSPSAIVNASLKATALGSLLRATQSLFIGEDDVSKEVAARCDPKNKWVRPVCVFAEGARTNRSSLISFKPGPFDSGDPVQPILVGWSSDANVETAWPDEAPHTLSRLFQCFMGRSLGISVKFLPVILPSKKEKENVSLYMNKVRKAMAFDLGIPMSDYATVDLLLARAASKRGLRPAYVLDFSVAELSRELQVEVDTLPEKIKLLLARYAKAPGMTFEGKINEKQFTRIAKKTALDVKRPTPLEWQDLVRTSALVNAEEGRVNTVSFRTFAIAHLTPSMLPAP